MNQQPDGDGQIIIHQLKSRFYKKPRICKKINDSGIGDSERILCLSDDTFYYYPKIQEFKDLDFDKLQYVIPKAGVKLVDIHELKFPNRRNNQRNYFSMVLPKNKILKYTKDNKEHIVDENAQGDQRWTFYFTYDIIILPEKQRRIERFLIKEKEAQANLREKRRKQKQLQQQQKQRQIEEHYNTLRQVQLHEQENQEGGNDYNRKKQQLKEQQKIEKKFNNAHQFAFNYFYRKLIENYNLSEEQIVNLELSLLQQVGQFSKRVQNVVQNFVDELPFSRYDLRPGVVFQIDGLYLKAGGKELNRQFLSNYYVADTIYRLKRQLKLMWNGRVPLYALIKYKGYKFLVRTVTPVDNLDKKQFQEKLLHGNTKQTWKLHFLLIDDLNVITSALNLKSYIGQVHYQKVQVHLGTNIKIIESRKDPFAQIKSLDKKKEHPQDSNYKVLYLIDIDQVFPIDLDLQNNINQSNVRLRPEFVKNFMDNNQLTKLNGGSLFQAIDDQEGEKDDLLLAKASQQLKYIKLKQFVKKLDQLQFVPFSSSSFGKILKMNGINIRYIGKVYKLTNLPFIRQMCQVQAISRTIKKIYKEHQREFCEISFRKLYSDKIADMTNKKNPPSLQTYRKNELILFEKQMSAANAIDYLNLIFGCTQQTEHFWLIIKQDVLSVYEIQIEQPMSLSHGYLLTSILSHCGFQVKIGKLKLFQNSNPFSITDWIGFKNNIQIFDFPSFLTYRQLKFSPNLNKKDKIARLQLNAIIKRCLKVSESEAMAKLSEFVSQIDPPKEHYSIPSLQYYLVHADESNFTTAHQICQFMLPASHPGFLDLYLTYATIPDFDPVMLKKTAQYHAIRNLGIAHWKTANILKCFQQNNYTEHLIRAQTGIQQGRQFELYLLIAIELQKAGKLQNCTEYVKKSIQLYKKRRTLFSENQRTTTIIISSSKQKQKQKFQNIYEYYFKILKIGVQINYLMRRIQDMLRITEYLWYALEDFIFFNKKQPSLQWYQFLLKESLRVYLESSKKKYYLYKIALALDERIHGKLNNQEKEDKIRYVCTSCRQSKHHINWIKQLLTKVQFGYSEINFHPDFFTNFDKHVEGFGSEEFNEGLSDLTIFLELFTLKYFGETLMDQIFVKEQKDFIE